MSMTQWMPAIVGGIALLKALVGITSVLVAAATGVDVPAFRHLMAAHALAYGLAGASLLATARDDRTRWLGVVFALVASDFSTSLLRHWQGDGTLLTLANAVIAVRIDALLPYYLWLFAGAFPQAVDSLRMRAWVRVMRQASAIVGTALLAINLVLAPAVALGLGAIEAALAGFAPGSSTGAYWILQFLLVAGAFPTVVARMRRAAIDERRRGSLLALALAVGTAPAVLYVIASSSDPEFKQALPLSVAGWIIYPALLSVPFIAAYAVLVRRALDVRVIVRRALQYAFARYSTFAIVAIPVALLVALLYARRASSVADIAADWRTILLAALCAAAFVATTHRRGVLDAIDRRFFREQYDARRILSDLVDRCRWIESREALDRVLRAEIERALHPTSVHVLFLDDAMQAFVAERDNVRPLSRSSPLVVSVARVEPPLEVDLEDPKPAVRDLPDEDRHWLADSNVRLVFPLRDAVDGLVGLLMLGEKRSELPYTAEDKALLASATSAAEMAVAYHGLERRAPVAAAAAAIADPADDLARECSRCGTVGPDASFVHCLVCDAATRPSPLPLNVAGKFRVEARVGAGGMGVVYRATDMHLLRAVAIKTLPYVAPDQAVRLRREARAMAAVSHPHLAQIFGIETWKGHPMLVVEYFGAGTLAERLRATPLSVDDAIELGIDLAMALQAVHDAGMLHRDVKPSNIAFAADGTPKLLDFGLARLVTTSQPGVAQDGSGDHGDASGFTLSATAGVIGTPAYMSPETLGGERPSPASDVWSLCVVLLEAVSGRRSLAGLDFASIGDTRLHEVLARGLAPASGDRIESARALAEQLRKLRRREPAGVSYRR